jgi:hypothetical protein
VGLLKSGCDLTEIHARNTDLDRRGNARYPLRLKLNFSTLTQPTCSGEGESLYISSKELLFAVKESFAAGQRLQVSLDWPARLQTIPLRLVVSGQILRSGDSQSLMTIDRYEFRIRGKEPSADGAGTLQPGRNLPFEPGGAPLGRDEQLKQGRDEQLKHY